MTDLNKEKNYLKKNHEIIAIVGVIFVVFFFVTIEISKRYPNSTISSSLIYTWIAFGVIAFLFWILKGVKKEIGDEIDVEEWELLETSMDKDDILLVGTLLSQNSIAWRVEDDITQNLLPLHNVMIPIKIFVDGSKVEESKRILQEFHDKNSKQYTPQKKKFSLIIAFITVLIFYIPFRIMVLIEYKGAFLYIWGAIEVILSTGIYILWYVKNKMKKIQMKDEENNQ